MAKWPANSVVTNGITLNYYRSGSDRPPLILCHGLSDSGLCWTRVAEDMQRDYDLIMVDARGHGRSDAPETGYGPDQHAADVAGLIRALELDNPALLGHSMGAMTSATVAATYPELVKCIVLEDPPWRDEDAEDPAATAARATMLEEWRAGIIKAKSQSPAEIVAEGRQRNPAWDEAEFADWSQAKVQASPNIFKYNSESKTPWRDTVSKISCPALLITGDVEAGGIVSPEVAGDIANQKPNFEVVHIGGAGHNIRREQFEQYMKAVRAFLAQHT